MAFLMDGCLSCIAGYYYRTHAGDGLTTLTNQTILGLACLLSLLPTRHPRSNGRGIEAICISSSSPSPLKKKKKMYLEGFTTGGTSHPPCQSRTSRAKPAIDLSYTATTHYLPGWHAIWRGDLVALPEIEEGGREFGTESVVR